MRRLLAAAMLCLLSVAVGAQSNVSGREAQIDRLVQEGLDANFDEIRAASGSLSLDQRLRLYFRHETNPKLPIAVNLFAGFGIGSFVQGDSVGGWVGLTADSVALVATGAGIILNVTDTSSSDWPRGLGLFSAGLVTLSVYRVFQLIRPARYSRRHNELLRHALGV